MNLKIHKLPSKVKHQNADLVMGSRFIGINRSVLNFGTWLVIK